MKHFLPLLPYSTDAFGEKLSKETFDFHYGKHHQAYVDNLNRMILGTEFEDMSLEEIVRKSSGGLFNNAAQAWNHSFFFMTLNPEKSAVPDNLAAKMVEAFGSVEAFKDAFVEAAVKLFGSGWVWLVEDEEGLINIVQTQNAGNPITSGWKPLMTIDVWEHAYYIDYRNARKQYVETCLELIDWNKVAERL